MRIMTALAREYKVNINGFCALLVSPTTEMAVNTGYQYRGLRLILYAFFYQCLKRYPLGTGEKSVR